MLAMSCFPHFKISFCSFVGSPKPLQVRYPTQSVKISILYHNFLIRYCRDFSLILHRPLGHTQILLYQRSFLKILGASYTCTDIGHSSIYGNWQGSLVDHGFWGGGIFDKWVIYGRITDNYTDNKDATRMLGTRFVACRWPLVTLLWPPTVQRKQSRTCPDDIGIHQDVTRTPRMGIRTLRTLTDGVYGSLFFSQMSAHR